jgi:hypothetical protein
LATVRKRRFTVIGGADYETAEGDAFRWFVFQVRALDAATAWRGAAEMAAREFRDARGPITLARIAVYAGYPESLLPMDGAFSSRPAA